MNALTANQVYQLPVQRYEFTQWETLEILHELNLNDIEMPDEQRRLVAKIHCTRAFDDRRYWRLGSLWLDENLELTHFYSTNLEEMLARKD